MLNIGEHNRRHSPPHSFLLTFLRASLSHFLLLLVMGDFTMIYHHHCHISAFLSPLSSCASRSSCGGIQDSFVVAPAVIRRHIIVSVLIAVAIEFRVAGILLRTSPSHLEACKSDAKKCDCAYTGRHQFFCQELAFDPSSTLTAHLSLEISRGHSTVCTPLHGMYSTLVPNHFQSNAVCTSPGHAPSVAQPCQATYAYAKHSQLWP